MELGKNKNGEAWVENMAPNWQRHELTWSQNSKYLIFNMLIK